MSDADHIEQHWPQVAALDRLLRGLPTEVAVAPPTAPATAAGDIDVAKLVDLLAQHQQRGGKVPWS